MKTGMIVIAILIALGFAVYQGAFPQGSWIGLLFLIPLAGTAVLGGYLKLRRDRKRRLQG